MRDLINADSMKNAIDQEQLDILSFFVSEPKRFAYIIHLLIELNGQYFNLVGIVLAVVRRTLAILAGILDPAEKEGHRSIVHQCTYSRGTVHLR